MTGMVYMLLFICVCLFILVCIIFGLILVYSSRGRYDDSLKAVLYMKAINEDLVDTLVTTDEIIRGMNIRVDDIKK